MIMPARQGSWQLFEAAGTGVGGREGASKQEEEGWYAAVLQPAAAQAGGYKQAQRACLR